MVGLNLAQPQHVSDILAGEALRMEVRDPFQSEGHERMFFQHQIPVSFDRRCHVPATQGQPGYTGALQVQADDLGIMKGCNAAEPAQQPGCSSGDGLLHRQATKPRGFAVAVQRRRSAAEAIMFVIAMVTPGRHYPGDQGGEGRQNDGESLLDTCRRSYRRSPSRSRKIHSSHGKRTVRIALKGLHKCVVASRDVTRACIAMPGAAVPVSIPNMEPLNLPGPSRD